jgi:hypothetical protein
MNGIPQDLIFFLIFGAIVLFQILRAQWRRRTAHPPAATATALQVEEAEPEPRRRACLKCRARQRSVPERCRRLCLVRRIASRVGLCWAIVARCRTRSSLRPSSSPVARSGRTRSNDPGHHLCLMAARTGPSGASNAPAPLLRFAASYRRFLTATATRWNVRVKATPKILSIRAPSRIPAPRPPPGQVQRKFSDMIFLHSTS